MNGHDALSSTLDAYNTVDTSQKLAVGVCGDSIMSEQQVVLESSTKEPETG